MIATIRHFALAAAAAGLLFAPSGFAHAPPAPPAPPPPPASGMRVMTFSGSGSYLGVGVKEVDTARAKELKLKQEAGVELTHVEDDGPASKAGLKTGDVVVEYNGQPVVGTEQFIRLVRETPAGRTVSMKISRAGNQQNVQATIGERKSQSWGMLAQDRERLERDMARVRERMRNLPEVRMPDIPQPVMSWRSGMIGIEGESVKGQLAEFFGVSEGVLVRSVAKDMPAAKAGVKAGDVITKVDDAKVDAPRDITTAIRKAKDKQTLKLTLMRQKAEMTLEVTLEAQKSEAPAAPKARRVGSQKDFEFEEEF
jgi:serine protease Do